MSLLKKNVLEGQQEQISRNQTTQGNSVISMDNFKTPTTPSVLSDKSIDHLFLDLENWISNSNLYKQPDYVCLPNKSSNTDYDLANFNLDLDTNKVHDNTLPDYLQHGVLSPVSDAVFSPSDFLTTEFDPEIFLG